jgi:hypothetical protein
MVLRGGYDASSGGGLHPVLAAQRNSTHTNTRNNVSLTVSKVMKDYVLRERAQKRRLKEEARLRGLMLEDEEGDEEIVDGIETSKIIVATKNATTPSSVSGAAVVRCKWMLEPTVEETRGLVQDIVSSSAPATAPHTGGADLVGWWGGCGGAVHDQVAVGAAPGGGGGVASVCSAQIDNNNNNNIKSSAVLEHSKDRSIVWPVFLSELHHIPTSWKSSTTGADGKGGGGVEAIKSLPYYPALVPAATPHPSHHRHNHSITVNDDDDRGDREGTMTTTNDPTSTTHNIIGVTDVTATTSTPPFVSAAAVFVSFREFSKATAAASSSVSLSFAQRLDLGRSKQRHEEQARKQLLDKRSQQRHLLIPLSRFQTARMVGGGGGGKGGTTTSYSSHTAASAAAGDDSATPTRFNASAPLPPLSRNQQLEPPSSLGGVPPSRDAVTGLITGWKEAEEEGTLRAEDISAITKINDGDETTVVLAHEKDEEDDERRDQEHRGDDGTGSEQMYSTYPERAGGSFAALLSLSLPPASRQPMMLGGVAAAALRAKAEKRRALQQQILKGVSFVAPGSCYDGSCEGGADRAHPPPDIFEIVHATLVDTLIALKRNQDVSSALSMNTYIADAATTSKEEGDRQLRRVDERARQQLPFDGKRGRVADVQGGSIAPVGVGGDIAVSPTTDDHTSTTCSRQQQEPRVISPPIRDVVGSADDGDDGYDGVDDSSTITGHLRDPAASEQLHRLSLFEVSSMTYSLRPSDIEGRGRRIGGRRMGGCLPTLLQVVLPAAIRNTMSLPNTNPLVTGHHRLVN